MTRPACTHSKASPSKDMQDMLWAGASPPSQTELKEAASAATASLRSAVDLLIDFDKPLVAGVNGNAIGAGLMIALLCDSVWAAAPARFAAPTQLHGLTPALCSTVLLPEAIGRSLANEMLLLGASLDSKRALEAGLVSRVFGTSSDEFKEQMRERALETAAKLKSNENSARSKDLICDAQLIGREREVEGDAHNGFARRDRLHAVNEREARVLAERLVSEEAMESLRGFLERR